MKRLWILVLCGLLGVYGLTIAGNPGTAQAQTEFKTALQKKYDYKLVSCNTCHVSGEEKTVRNDFGKLFAKELEGKKVTERLEAVKDLESDDAKRVKVKEETTEEFLAALKKIEDMKSANGKTYGELLKAGEIEGVKLKE
jgi:cytochrome c553